jgi:hypothetical protein
MAGLLLLLAYQGPAKPQGFEPAGLLAQTSPKCAAKFPETAIVLVDVDDIDRQFMTIWERQGLDQDTPQLLKDRAEQYTIRKNEALGSFAGIETVTDYENFPLRRVHFTTKAAWEALCESQGRVKRIQEASTFLSGALLYRDGVQTNSIAVFEAQLEQNFCDVLACKRFTLPPIMDADCGDIAYSRHMMQTISVAWEIDPGANILSFGGTPCRKNVDVIAMIDALQHLIQNRDRYNLAALNLSVGFIADEGLRDSPNHDDIYEEACTREPVEQALQRAIWAGISVVVSAGNVDTIDGVTSPACVPGVIAVGAVFGKKTPIRNPDLRILKKTYEVDDVYPDTASGNLVTVVAPSGNIKGSFDISSNEEDALAKTSGAAPQVAAAISRWRRAETDALDSGKITRRRTGPEIRRMVMDSGHWLGISKPRLDFELGLRMVRGDCLIETINVGYQQWNSLHKGGCYSRLMSAVNNAAFYEIRLPADQKLQIDVHTPAYSWKPRVSVTDMDGNDGVKDSLGVFSMVRTTKASVSFEAKAGRRYLVEVTSILPNCIGNFNIRIYH